MEAIQPVDLTAGDYRPQERSWLRILPFDKLTASSYSHWIIKPELHSSGRVWGRSLAHPLISHASQLAKLSETFARVGQTARLRAARPRVARQLFARRRRKRMNIVGSNA